MHPWVDQLTALLAPDSCLFCGESRARDGICQGCSLDLPWNKRCCPKCALPLELSAPCAACAKKAPAFDSATTAFVHVEPVRRAVHQLKYSAQFTQARTLGRLLAMRLQHREAPLPDLIIAVPISRRRLFSRGYNQVTELGHHLGQQLRVPLATDAVKLRRGIKEQIGQGAAQRRRNLRAAFHIDQDLSNLHVAVLDDVMTTGATLDALARAARKAGAKHIEAWAVARAP